MKMKLPLTTFIAIFLCEVLYAQQSDELTAPLPSMVLIPAGSFTMGSDAYSDEQPIHQVNVSAFLLSETEVSQRLWEAITGENPSKFQDADKPVENVSWDDIQEFILILNQNTGKNYRLPSESEWEYAARAGTTTEYYWGETSSTIDANYYQAKIGATATVKSYQPNAWGLYDMSGNVWEWVQDCYQESYLGKPVSGSAREICDTDYRVMRGGSWQSGAGHMRLAYRFANSPSDSSYESGFRLAMDN